MGHPLKSARRNRRPFQAEALEIRRLLTADYLYSLEARTGAPDDGFGWSHAASADYHIVGNPFLDRQPMNGFVGEVQVHDADTGALLRTIANPDPGDLYRFGYSVDIFEDLIVIGAIGWGDLNTGDTTVPGYSDRSGRAYLFEASTGNLLFTFDGTFTTGNPLSEDHDQFGASVSIDGNYVVVGAPGISPFEQGGISPLDDDAGHAYIFSTATGTLLHVLGSPEPEAANPGTGEFDLDFGLSVSTSNGKVVVGNHDTEAYGAAGNSHAGKAYIFDAASGQLQHTLIASDILELGETTFGHRVAIDENLIAVSMDSTSFPLTYIFDATTGNFNQILEDVMLADINADQIASRVFVSNAQPTIFGSILNADSGSLISTIPLPPGYESETPSFLSSVSLFQTRLLVGEAILQPGNSGSVFVYDTGTNAPPTDITLSADTVAELASAGTVVGDLAATDSTPGETLTFSLLNSSGGRFAIDGANLIVANGSLLNFEQQTTHSVTIRVTDSAGNTYDEAFIIDVTDVNEAATLISLTPSSESENTTDNAVVGSLSSNDPDASETESFVLLDDAGGRFMQDGLMIRVADASLLDFETDSSHQIIVRVTDSAAHVLEQVVTINITDFNYQPTDIGLTGTTVSESATSLLRNPGPERQLGFGSRVAASGTRLLVSHLQPFSPFTYDGRVYLYDAVTQSQIATLSNPTGTPDDRFGQGIAISDTYAIVGAAGEDTVAEDSGRAYVFDSTTGALLHVLNNPDQTAASADDEFGSQVSISGTLIAIHSRQDAIAPLAGAVHLFDAVSGNLLTTIQSPEPTESGQFGAAISMMGNKILIGAPANNSSGMSSGRVYLYEYDSTANTTSLLVTLDNPTPDAFDLFGLRVAVTADVLVVAAPGDNTGAADAGRVYLFNSNTGALLHTLQAPVNEAGDIFGTSLAAMDDRVIVASRQANGLSFSGQVHVFSTTTGNLLATIDNPTPETGDLFGDLGDTIAVNTTHIVVGAIGDQTDGIDAGIVYLLDMPIGEVIGTLSAVDAESTETFTFSLTDSADGRFGIDGNNLIVADPAKLDFEVSTSHDVTVQVTDSGGATFSETFTIQVANVVEKSHIVPGTSGDDDFVLTYSPSIFGGTVSVTVSTNGGAVTLVGTYSMQQPVVLNGMAGSDSILVVGTSGADLFSALSENLWSINGASLGLSSIETRSVDLGAGNDQYYFDADTPLGTFSILEPSGGTDRISLSPTTTVDVSVNLGLTALQAVHPTHLTLQLQPVNAFEQAEGGSGNDLLTGNSLPNAIFGRSGNDTITGDSGSDVLFGGLGDDLYVFNNAASAEADILLEQMDEGIDTLSFASVATAVSLNLNLTSVQSVHLNRTLQLNSPEAFEDIVGGSAGDTLTGNAANNRIQGRGGNDVLTGAGGNDNLEGGVGNDLYVLANAPTAESDFLVEHVGQGTDTISFSNVTSNIKMYLSSNGIQNVHLNRLLQINSGTNFENMYGGSGVNDLIGNVQNNVLTGQGNPDSLVGNGGNDTLIGGGGNDSIVGGEGSDFMDGGSGNDLYTFYAAGTAEADSILELDNNGVDTVTFSTVSDNIALSLATTATQSIHLNRTLALIMESTIENVYGGNGNDTLAGNSLRNEIRGSNGNDTLHVGAAPVGEVEFVVGGSGNDSYVFQAQPVPANVLIVEAVGAAGGIDQLDFGAISSDVSVWLNSSATYAVYANQTLQLNSSGSMEIVSGGSGNDQLFGNALDNVINGNDGNDTLRGSSGSDQLNGGAGDDFYGMEQAISPQTDSIIELAGGGTDHVSFTSVTSNVTLSLAAAGSQPAHTNRLVVIQPETVELLTGGVGHDTLTGNSLVNVLNGGPAGNDTFHMSATPAGLIDSLLGGSGNDRYIFYPQSTESSVFISEYVGQGDDTLDFSLVPTSVTVWLNSNATYAAFTNQTLQINSSTSFENLIGGSGGDTLFGNNLANTIVGNDGADLLFGLAQDDILSGGNGNDGLTDGDGSDLLSGGSGDDNYQLSPVTAMQTDTVDEISGGSGGIDTLSFAGIVVPVTINLNVDSSVSQQVHINRNLFVGSVEFVAGGSSHDIIIGNSLANYIDGRGGRDILVGGGINTDQLVGGNDDDILIPGSSTDELNHPAWLMRFSELRDAWTSGASYSDRVNSIRTGVGANLSSLQAGLNVLDDSLLDTLIGGLGQDWYFKALNDFISDLFINEVVDTL